MVNNTNLENQKSRTQEQESDKKERMKERKTTAIVMWPLVEMFIENVMISSSGITWQLLLIIISTDLWMIHEWH